VTWRLAGSSNHRRFLRGTDQRLLSAKARLLDRRQKSIVYPTRILRARSVIPWPVGFGVQNEGREDCPTVLYTAVWVISVLVVAESKMWIVRLALGRPYTFVVMAILIAILGGSAVVTMPVDIFPYIDIPIVSVLWVYNGLSAEEMEKRVVTYFERSLTSNVNDIEHIESQVVQRLCGNPDLLPSKRQGRHGGGPGDRHYADLTAPDAARDVFQPIS